MMPLANKRLFLLPRMMSNCLAFCDLFSDGYQMGTLSYSHVYRRFPRTKHKVTPPVQCETNTILAYGVQEKKGGRGFEVCCAVVAFLV